MKPKYGRIHKVVNKQAKFGANRSYNYVKVKLPCGETRVLLLTDTQMLTAQERAFKNKEDCDFKLKLSDWLKR